MADKEIPKLDTRISLNTSNDGDTPSSLLRPNGLQLTYKLLLNDHLFHNRDMLQQKDLDGIVDVLLSATNEQFFNGMIPESEKEELLKYNPYIRASNLVLQAIRESSNGAVPNINDEYLSHLGDKIKSLCNLNVGSPLMSYFCSALREEMMDRIIPSHEIKASLVEHVTGSSLRTSR